MAHIKRSFLGGTPNIKCTQCGYKGKGKSYCPGSLGVEIILRLCMIIPGLIYSLWRSSGKGYICPQCGNHNVISIKKSEVNKIEESSNKFDQLEKITLLREKGTLTEEEFLLEKEKIMGK